MGPGALTVIASYSGCNDKVVVVVFVLAMFTMGGYYAGQKLSPMDMSPTFSGTLNAICNGLGSLAGLAAPPIVGLMTPQVSCSEFKFNNLKVDTLFFRMINTMQATESQWHGVFWLGLVILVLSGIIFWIWGSADVQPYDPNYQSKQA